MNIVNVNTDHELFNLDFEIAIQQDELVFKELRIMIESKSKDIVIGADVTLENIDNNKIDVILFVHNGEKLKTPVWYECIFGENELAVMCNAENKDILEDFKKKGYVENGTYIVEMVLKVICYIQYTSKHRLRTNIVGTNNYNKHKNIPYVSRNGNKIYLLDDIKLYDNCVRDSGKEIQCPCWSVRGHYRHYKNGKVVFIQSYNKGKDRANVKPKAKEYYV